MFQNLRYSLRSIRQAPGFSLVVTLTLMLGIGATTAIFSVVDAVLLRPLPYPAAGSLMMLFDIQSDGREVGALSGPELADWRERGLDVFDAVGAFGARGEVLSGAGEAEQLLGAQVTSELPTLLGIQPIVGRIFRPDDERPGSPAVVMLSEGLWRSRFDSDPAIVGRTVTLTGQPHIVIGVFPAGPSTILPSPYYMARGKPADFFEPLPVDRDPASRGTHHLDVIARLRTGVALPQAEARIGNIAASIKKDRGTNHGLTVHPLAGVLVGDFKAPLALLLSAVGLLLLIACGNVANLLLARSAARQTEFAVRSALGAGRARIVTLVLVDSATRAVIGGAFGVALAYAIVQVARTVLAGSIPRIGMAQIDARVLTAAVGLTLVSGVLFGLMPALRAVRRDIVSGLSGARGAVTTVSRDAVRRTLIVAEIALSFVLLCTAGLLADSYRHLMAVPKGFDASALITGRVWLPSTRYADGASQTAFFDRLTERLGASLGSDSVTLTSDLPIAGGTYGSVPLANPKFVGGASQVEKRIVSPNYFGVLKARLLRGRFFEATDREGTQPVVVVNETFAHQWLEGDPIGQQVAFAWGINGQQTVIGVVADIRENALDAPPRAAIYISRAQRPHSDMHIMIRTSRAASEVVGLMRAAIAGLDPALPLIDVKSASEVVASSARERELVSAVLEAFAVSALLLAAIGVYGVISYSVAQRTQELGIRAALGAGRGDLVRLVLVQSLGLTAAGVFIGEVAAIAASGLLSSQLFGVAARDPRIYAVVGVLVCIVSLVASALPTLRATRANPLDALRSV